MENLTDFSATLESPVLPVKELLQVDPSLEMDSLLEHSRGKLCQCLLQGLCVPVLYFVLITLSV